MARTKKDTKRYQESLSEKINSYPPGGIPSKFKRLQKKTRRAKEKAAFRKGEEDPNFKKCDGYDWW